MNTSEIESHGDEIPPAFLDAAEAQPVASDRELPRIVESLLFASDKPLSAAQLRKLTKADLSAVHAALQQLELEYSDRGIVLHNIDGGYQFRTHPATGPWVQRLVDGKPVRLTKAQLESLAIVAYRQPVTKPDIDEIRGVDSAGSLKTLLDRDLIRVLGKKEEAGRPLLYGTTHEFLQLFQLSALRDLPTLREYHELNDESRRLAEELGVELDEQVTTDNVEAPAMAADAETPAMADADAPVMAADVEAPAMAADAETPAMADAEAPVMAADAETPAMAAEAETPAMAEAETPATAADADADADARLHGGVSEHAAALAPEASTDKALAAAESQAVADAAETSSVADASQPVSAQRTSEVDEDV